MTKLKVIGIVTLVVVMVLAAGSAWAQPGGKGGPGGGGGMRGGMGGMMFDQTWTDLCFGIGISSTQIEKLRPTFAWAYKERNTTVRTAMQSRDREAVQAKAKQMKEAIDKAIRIVLTKDQMAKYTKMIAEREAERAKMREQFGAGKGGGPGGKGGGKAK